MAGEGSIGCNAMFQTIQFPTLIASLDPGLSQMNGNALCAKWMCQGMGGWGLGAGAQQKRNESQKKGE